MKFKEFLEKLEDCEEVSADLMVHTIDSHSYRHKVFTAWASDFLTDKIWLDKEIVKINNELIDGYTIRINVLLHD